jgi:hypothetical protein
MSQLYTTFVNSCPHKLKSVSQILALPARQLVHLGALDKHKHLIQIFATQS